ELAAGDKAALDQFWQEVERRGTPLTEPIAGDEKNLLVTFLWRATFETWNVLVLWTPFSAERPDDYKMMRLADSNLWYKTLRAPKGARFLYQLSPNDTLTRAPNAQRFATAQFDPLNPRRRPDDPNLTKYEVFSIAELPGAPAQEWAVRRPEAPAGKVEKQKYKSLLLNNERDITIYTPANYLTGAAPFSLRLLSDIAA